MHFPYLVKGRLLSLTHCSCILIVPSWIVLQLLTLVCSVIPFLILWYVEYLVVQPVEAQYNVLFQKKVCVKNYLLLQQSLLFVIPPTPSHSLLFPLAPSPARHCASLSLWSLISAMSLATSHFLLFLLSQDNPPHTSLSPAQPLAFSFLKVYSLTILFILIT